ncbi:MAG: sigma-70 family RNA polymerase sigma factor [Firmicutes bacterium]|nr:sigma-70 family RNA polymerase sigma factor [Bacillota bacterium]
MMFKEYLDVLSKQKLLSPDEEARLWSQYKEEGKLEARATLIKAYQPLVIKLLAGFTVPDDLGMDLLQEGTVGLIEAVEKYEPRQGVPFPVYARYRIRGRIVNLLSQYSARKRSEILAGDEYLIGVEEAASARYRHPEGVVEEQELQGQVRQAFSRLPEKERRAVAATFVECLSSQSAAKELEVSPSYFYKLQKKALRRMRGMMAKFIADSRGN